MGLMGDASDNIPGISGIGEKSAVELISEFGTLEKLLENADKIKGEAKKKLIRSNRDIAILSKELAVLDTNVPIKTDFKEMELKSPDQEALLELFKELEFKSLLKDVTPKGKLKSEYALIETAKVLDKLIAQLKTVKEFAFDAETTHEDPMLATIVGISFAWEEGRAYYVPMNKNLDPE